jgi:hypothetical protein
MSETFKHNVQPARLQRLNFVLGHSGINLIYQRTIAVKRFAVLDFHRSLPNARLQSGRLDIVLHTVISVRLQAELSERRPYTNFDFVNNRPDLIASY